MAQLQSNMPHSPLLRVEPFRGIDLSVTPTQIDDHQAADILNMTIDERGALNKRTGYERMYVKSLGDGPINGMFLYRLPNGSETMLFSHKDKLYKTEGAPSLANNTRLQVWEDDDLEDTWVGEE